MISTLSMIQFNKYTMGYLRLLFFFYVLYLTLSQIIPCSNACAACINGPDKCTACPERFQLNTQSECVTDNNNYCALYSVNSEYCLSCEPTFRSQNGTCIKDMSGCVQYQSPNCSKCAFGRSLVSGVCVGTLNCLTYNDTICTSCQKGYFLSRNICYSMDSNCLRIDYSSGACLKCVGNLTLVGFQCIGTTITSKNCYIFDAKGICSFCKRGYLLFNGTCIAIPLCKNTYYLSPTYQCISLPSGCKMLDSLNSTCKECNPNHQLTNGSCIPDLPQNCTSIDSSGKCLKCSERYYSSNYSCWPVSPFCGTFSSEGKCLTCRINYFVNLGGLCKDPYCANMTQTECLLCHENFEYSSELQKCILVDPNCQTLTETSCSQCFDGYYLSFDICKPLPSDCLSAAKSGACLECQTNYYFQFNACFPVNMTVPNCRVYSQITSSSVCQICEIGYFIYLGKCVQIPPFCSLLLSNGNCAICISGYKLTSNTCVPQKGVTNQYCANMGTKECLRCNSNSVLGINGFCYPTNNTKCQTSDEDGNCLVCNQGYLISRGICLAINIVDVNCKTYNKNQCTECYQGYYLANNQCKLPNANCSTYSLTNGGCLTCFVGFTLTNSQCVIMTKVANCVSYDGSGNCLQCAHMYFITNNTCISVNPICQNYNSFTGDCTSCFPGYSLKSKNCIKQDSPLWSSVTNLTAVCKSKRGSQCVECPFRYYLRNNLCILVSSSCLTYDSNGNCLACNVGFFLKNHNCVSFGTLNGTDPNCKLFQQQSFCLECYNGFINLKGTCESVDPLCRSYDNMTGHCTSCYEGYTLNNMSCLLQGMQTLNPCQQQDSQGQCLSCIVSYYLVSHKCVYNETFKANNYNIPFCQVAANSSYCTICSEGFYPRSGSCYQVSSYCQTYNPSTGDCLTCKDGYIFETNTCVYPAMGLDPKCTSYSGVYCSVCNTGYYLKNYVCTPIDPRCLDFNSDINQCLQCSSGNPVFDICQ